MRPLALLAHGTRSQAGIAVVEEVARRAAEAAGAEVRLGYVDVCEPTAWEVLAGLERPVVVPYFVTSGYHVDHDVPDAAARARAAVVTPALGAAPEVVRALADRLPPVSPGTAVLLGGAGSSRDAARDEAHEVAGLLAAELGVPVRAGFLSGPGPQAADVLAELRSDHGRVVAGALLLAPGFFHRQLEVLGADAVAAPLGTHPALVDLVVRRYRDAAG
ncbi:sirohydrochlorin chelatase [Ornithinicoccus halotolerans]|uniref:sirohydrochlorin chelatase n=1 Tax=Ornithinicoccus halotolerans TaxID=1748220 RepID=UPI0018863F26|nr:CbiX/SirB N-terminal domain-containing protein [Ornithinicoccus halotolerans]